MTRRLVAAGLRLGGSHQWLMETETVDGMVPLPTETTEVLEAVHVAAEEGAHYPPADVAGGVLEVGVHLDLLGEFGGFDFDVARLHRFHVVLGAHECDTAGPDWVFVPVCVDAGVHHPAEQVVHYERQSVGVQQPVETTHKHGGVGI